jgi:hypothetical protein
MSFPDVTLAEGGADPGNDIDIDPRYGVMAGVKIGSDLRHLEDVDAGRQQVIQSLPDFPGLLPILYGEMCYLTQGMDTGVRSSCPLDIHILAEKLARRLDKRPLHGPGVLLGLPPPIARTVIFQGQFVFHRRRYRHIIKSLSFIVINSKDLFLLQVHPRSILAFSFPP